MQDTSKITLKTVNKLAHSTAIYLNRKEREHIGIRKGDVIIIDRSIPDKLIITSARTYLLKQ